MIATGSAVALCEGVDKLMENIGEVRPTMLLAVPRVWNRLYAAVVAGLSKKPAPVRIIFRAGIKARLKERRGEHLSITERAALGLADKLIFSKVRERLGGQLERAMVGGSALSRDVAEFVEGIGVTLHEGYGLTEASLVVTLNRPGQSRLGSVGKPIPGVSVTIDEGAGHSPGEGEIIVRGPCVMRGYHRLPEETKRAFTADGGLRTGDLGRLDDEGFLYVTGRIKESYKLTNGEYVAPAQLEEQLNQSPYVQGTMVYGANRPYNVAMIAVDRAALTAWAREQGLPTEDMDALLRREEVRALYRREIEAHSAGFKHFERIGGFVLTAEDLTIDNGRLTPKLSLKRRNVEQRYLAELDALYD